MAKNEREAEKYDIVRLWSYTDDTTQVKERHRIPDGLLEDKNTTWKKSTS
ncbi:hypothetical protein [Hoylesella nanceiensis]|jgi:hypothetical protein|nr:hypothetical protein [Hoylesella nanceiensis]MBW4767245.1 hypothetical protein [Hoylesella nanceiensis]